MKKSELKELYQMMFPEYPDIVTVRQLREMLGISRQLAYDLINGGELQAIKIGNSFKIPKVSVINYFPKSYTNKQVCDTVLKLLEQWQRRWERDRDAR